MSFSVIQTGGKQYAVSKGDTIAIEKLADGLKAGDKVVFDKVLLVSDGHKTLVGAPYLAGTEVSGTVSEVGRAPKVLVVRYKQKSRSGWKRNGHRQPFVKVKID